MWWTISNNDNNNNNNTYVIPHSWHTRCVTRIKRRMWLPDRERTLFIFFLGGWGSCCSFAIVFCVVFWNHCLSFLLLELYCLPFDLQLLMAPLVSSNLIWFYPMHNYNININYTVQNDRPYLFDWEEVFKDTKGAIRIRILKKNRQHNGQKKKDKRTNNDQQNIHIKLKIEEHEPHQKPGGELRCSERVSSSCSTGDTRRVNLDVTITTNTVYYVCY